MQPAIASTAGAWTLTAARVSVGAAAAAVCFLTILHFLSPEFDPARRMVSEYALGDHRWAVASMFIASSVSNIALVVALRSDAPSTGARIGLFLLLLAGVGGLCGAIFGNPTDPRHGFAFALGVPTLPIAALVLSTSLRHNPSYEPWWTSLRIAGHLPWLSLAAMMIAVAVGLSARGGKWTPNMPVGWPNRLLVVAYNVWVGVAAWSVAHARAGH